jgi:3',5'-cyclic AMP phosphodiesterase CpdA
MCAIMGALQSDIISCLPLTHKTMSRQDQKDYKKLTTFLKPESNYSAYKAAVQHDGSRGFIPWHGVHFSYLTSWYTNELWIYRRTSS